ncbi:hypothetical protein AGMMS50268_20750 [Spirochaetia bacterium]|nr:hypothetical protein AGMMS50268_20750 [Spirochaetia bacterium]
MNTKIRVGGNIISELSEKIPTNIIALNELIKNSYDAGASSVTVELDTSRKLLIIRDDGSGMGQKDIDTLFHISKSNKVHGKKNEYGRITQGSKGLGFLSVFKFGKIVEWKTNSNKGFKFSVDYDKLIAANDISQFEIELSEDDTIPHGTEIIIKLDKYNVQSLKEYFSIEKNYKKILNSFDDDSFIIELVINNDDMYSSKDKTPLLDNEKEQQLYHITYNNKSQEIVFKHNGYIAIKKNYPFPFTQFSLDVELLTFQFKSHGKEKVDKLFFNPIDDLTPLIYFNSNLFNNYSIFDPNIMRNIKTGQVLNQMIGFIKIISKNPAIDFNSDRSQFLQNQLTDSIKDFLYEINKTIQEIGSAYKKYTVDFDFLTTKEISANYIESDDHEEYRKLIKDDFAFKDKIKINVQQDKVIYSLFGRTATLKINNDEYHSGSDDQETKNIPVPVRIVLNCNNEQEVAVPSKQIDLRGYVDSVYNSSGEFVDKDELLIKVNNKKRATGILESIVKPCEKIVDYIYSDSKTNAAIEKIKISFVKPTAYITTKKSSGSLFTIPSKKDYPINISQYLDKLINQINSLEIKKFMEMVSCSLRSLFELSVDSIIKSGKYPVLFNNTNDFDEKVLAVINFIKSKKEYISAISTSTKIDYKSLNNILFVDDFKKIIKKSHLGSHKSTMYITETDIRDISRYASFFIIFVNEMINNPALYNG